MPALRDVEDRSSALLYLAAEYLSVDDLSGRWFQLGGSSLDAVRFLGRARRELGVALNLRDLLTAESVLGYLHTQESAAGVEPALALGAAPLAITSLRQESGDLDRRLHIRIVSPALCSMAYFSERVQRAEATLVNAGYRVSYGEHAFAVAEGGVVAGTPQQRADDLCAAFADPDVDAILCSDTGEGSRDLLPFLDEALIRANPKPFIGFCDNVYLNQYLHSRAGLPSLYGCVYMNHFGESGGAFPETVEYLNAALSRNAELRYTPVPSRSAEYFSWHDPELERRLRKRSVSGGWDWIVPGTGEGVLWGGELTVLPELIEMFDLRTEGTVLFWDLSEVEADRLERDFLSLCEATDLSLLSGMLVGPVSNLRLDQWSDMVSQLLARHLPGVSYPVIANADIGHLHPCWVVPYGERIHIHGGESNNGDLNNGNSKNGGSIVARCRAMP
jgi:muramoyltetrapeptide carboxypeptidase